MSSARSAPAPAAPGESLPIGQFTVHWERRTNEHGDPLLWFGSWLLLDGDSEGDWFYSGRGDETTSHPVPAAATGARIRCWPSEALEAEYVDVALNVDGARLGELHTAHLTFDTKQPHSHLPEPGASTGRKLRAPEHPSVT